MLDPNYNNIAWHYDRLSNLIFGKKQELAKMKNLHLIPDKAKVLVVGGGTGTILEHLANQGKNIQVDFIDISPKMIKLAKGRKVDNLNVSYWCESIEEFELINYDVVITNFFFDQYNESKTLYLLGIIRGKLKKEGLLLFSDFQNPKDLKNKIVHRLMKLYFYLSINLGVNKYPDYLKAFSKVGFKRVSSGKIADNIINYVFTYS